MIPSVDTPFPYPRTLSVTNLPRELIGRIFSLLIVVHTRVLDLFSYCLSTPLTRIYDTRKNRVRSRKKRKGDLFLTLLISHKQKNRISK